jgi:hypothetical protein
MNLLDPELQEKIDRVDGIRLSIGSNLFGALSQASELEQLFPIPTNGDKRIGEQAAKSEPEIPEEQAGLDSEIGSTDTPY